MSSIRKFKDLTIRDNFMFAAVMMQGDNCKKFLELLLGIEIARIEISYEKSIIYNPECKGVRLDVFAKDECNTCYDIENRCLENFELQLGDGSRSIFLSTKGKLEMKRSDILELVEELGRISKSTYERIMSENNEDILKQMHKVAAKSDSIEQFEKMLSNL